MKRLLALLLALLLLAGCVAQPPDPVGGTDPTGTPATTETAAPGEGLYDPDSAVEQQTAGAVRAYPLDGYCDGILLMGDRLLLYYLDEQMRINVYSGDELNLQTSVTHSLQLPTNGRGIRVTEQNLSYYSQETNTLVILDAQLQEKYSVALPVDIRGIPVVNRQMDTVYYCTNEGIRAINLETGIAHMLRQQENYSGALYQQCFDGEILVCTVTNSDGSTDMEFVTAENGLQVGKTTLRSVESVGDWYFLQRDSQGITEYLFGTRDGEVHVFAPAEPVDDVRGALEMGGVLTVRDNGASTVLELYDLESGLRASSVTLEAVAEIRSITVDPRGYVWFMDSGDVLYRWEVGESPVSDDVVYTSAWYTGDTPNTDGLAKCQADADALAQKYGVKIHIWEDAVEVPWDDMTAEFRVEVYEDALPVVDEVLSVFPEGFLAQLSQIGKDDLIRISLVADTGMETGQQEWLDGNIYIAVETGDDLRAELLRALYRVMDTYVLGENSMLDEWDADKPAEDRAQLFVEAMAEENGEYFESSSAQRKLRTLCRAIRDAFGMKKYDSALPWEQYLDDPLH